MVVRACRYSGECDPGLSGGGQCHASVFVHGGTVQVADRISEPLSPDQRRWIEVIGVIAPGMCQVDECCEPGRIEPTRALRIELSSARQWTSVFDLCGLHRDVPSRA